MTVLLVGARSPAALALARALASAGARVVAADPYPLPLCRWSRSVSRTVRVPSPRLDEPAFRAAIAALVAEEDVQEVIAGGEEVLALRPAGVHELHDKATFNALAASLAIPGVRAPRTGDELDGERIVKPRRGRFGHGVRLVAAGQDARAGADEIVQERVRGEELSSLSWARGGAVVAHVVYRPLARIRRGPSLAIAPVDGPPAIERFAAAVAARAGWSGALGFDWIVEADGTAVPLECNPRPTLGVLLFAGLGEAILGRGRATVRAGAVRLPFAWVRGARDAIWDGEDRAPWWHQLDTAPFLVWVALRHRVSLRVAASFLSVPEPG